MTNQIDPTVPVPVEIRNWTDSVAKPKVVARSSLNTYRLDPSDPKLASLQIATHEPSRLRTLLYVLDNPVLASHELPNSTPGSGLIPRGLYLPVSADPYVLLGPDPIWINTINDGSTSQPFRPADTASNPAAGSEISITVPANERWRLMSMMFTFATDATVSNRRPHIVIDDGANPLWEWVMPVDQAASLSIRYSGGVTTSEFAGPGAPRQSVTSFSIPQVTLESGWRIITNTTNLQAGDDYSAVEVSYLTNLGAVTRVGVVKEYC